MDFSDWKGKKIAVLGFGVEGISSAKFLQKQGAEVTVLDKKEEKELDGKTIKELKKKGVKFVFGKDYLKNLGNFDVIIRSPGVSLNLEELGLAKKKGILITSQIKLFFELCPGKIIGVTGTKGKGTTSSLIYEMLKKQDFDVYLGGNIGKPPFEFLEKLNEDSWVVLELSSFQLIDLEKSPYISVVLMITSEHLDFHKDIKEYIEAKRNILRFQESSDFAVINRDYLASHESDIFTDGKVFQISRERPCEEGCYVKDGKVIVRIPKNRQNKASDFFNYIRGEEEVEEENFDLDYFIQRKTVVSYRELRDEDEIVREEIIDTKQILLPGKHNLENICASVMAAKLAGVSNKNIASVLKSFKGLEHRLELVQTVNGAYYYDDSFSTTPETAIAAIEAFNPPAGGEILILGGSSKKSDFTELGSVINKAKNVKAIIGIGEEWKRIKAQLKVQSAKFKVIEGCKNMKEIVREAAKIAEPGDVVLLSPACASFDMFKNYKDRGEQFKMEVKKLKNK